MTFFKENADELQAAVESGMKPDSVSNDDGKKKFLSPRISLFDIDGDVCRSIKSKWRNVVLGSLGGAYKVETSSEYQPVISRVEIGKHAESEIVIVDFEIGEPGREITGQPNRPDDELGIWSKCDIGYIDNRIQAVRALHSDMERIHLAGGVFIFFAAPSSLNDYAFGRKRRGRSFEKDDEIGSNIWGMLTKLAWLSGNSDSGNQITVCDSSDLGKLLSRYIRDSRFECTFRVNNTNAGEWHPLAKNKYDQIVALVQYPNKSGLIIIVPQLADKGGFLTELLEDVLPDMVPEVFPELSKGKWTHSPEYELLNVLSFQNEKKKIEQQAQIAIAELDSAIEREREHDGWIHDLITGTGDVLVSAIEKSFAEIGFVDVVDMDKVRDQTGDSRREDLQIRDMSPLLVVDIKGVGGLPSDDDVTQANKHMLLNLIELERKDIKALSIINHQRHLPALDRNNDTPFRKEMLDISIKTKLGLMTSFDLYKILLNMRKNGWKAENVKPIFYESGRISIVPKHYRCIGKIGMVMTEKFGVIIEGESVTVGDTIAIGSDIFFEEKIVESIQIDLQAKQTVNVGDKAGFLWQNSAIKLKKDMLVYRVCK